MIRTIISLIAVATLLAGAVWAQATAPTFVARVQTIDTTLELGEGATATILSDGVGSVASATVTFINRGTQSVTVNFTSFTGSSSFSISALPETPFTVDPGGIFGATVRFQPVASTQALARLSFNYRIGTNRTTSDFVLNLSGLTPEFAFSYTPQGGNATPVGAGGTIQLPATTVGSTSTTTVVLSNRGTGTGTINAVTLSGAPEIQVVGLPLPGAKVEPGRELRFSITYAPTRITAVSASLTFETPAGRIVFPVAGTGQGPAFRYSAVLDVGPVAFQPGGLVTLPDALVGEKSSLVIRVTNNGNADGRITTINIAGTGFALSETPFLPVVVAPGNSFTITVNFSPATAGRASGRLRIGDDNFDLTANGLGAALSYAFAIGGVATSVAPNGTVVFTPAPVGGTSTLAFQLSNTGTAPATVTSIGITTATTVFSLASIPPLPLTLQPGESAAVDIHFAPTALGITTATLRVDTQSFTLSGTGTSPAPLPAIRFEGASGPQQPLQQPAIGLSIASAYPLTLKGTLVLNFSSDVFSNDPSVQFATGGRTVEFTIPANSTRAVFPSEATQVRVQTGSVAGVITVTPTFATEGGINLTPSTPPTLRMTVAEAAPRIIGVVVSARTQTGVTLQISGYATSRSVTQMQLQFTPVAGESVSTTSVTVPVEAAFLAWYRNQQSAAFGSLFTATVPLTMQGDVTNVASAPEAIQSVSVSLANALGSSPAVSVNLR